ncbi:MAG: triple tyrosine motif-containing protein [Bacteroidia bacterium]
MLCICIALTTTIKAQKAFNGIPDITSYPRTAYKAGTQNWSILQDGRGVMYFGNNKGLLEFDGTNWLNYALPNRTIVRSFAQTSDSLLFVGAQNEFGIIHFSSKHGSSYESLVELIPEEYRGFEDVWQTFIVGNSVYFCTEKMIFLYKDKVIRTILPKSGRFENFFNLKNQLIIQEKDLGLYTLSDDQLKLYNDDDQILGQRIIALLPYTNGNVMMISSSAGMFINNGMELSKFDCEASNFIKANQAYCAIRMHDGTSAIGCAQNGLILIDSDGKIIQELNKQSGLQNNTVLSLYQDAQRNLWLGLDNGIDHVLINSPFSIIGSESNIEGTGYASEVIDGTLYLGTNQGLFYRKWNSTDQSSDELSFQRIDGTQGQVWSINKLGEAHILGQHKGAFLINDKKLEKLSDIQGAWKFIQLRQNPQFAIEGSYSGFSIYQFDKLKNKWQFIRKLEGFDESARIFEEDESGDFWISHAYKGLFRLTLSKDLSEIKAIKRFDTSYGLPTDLFLIVSKIRDELVFSTPKGIYKFNKNSQKFIPHDDFNEIFGPNRNVHRLIEDELGNVWFSIDNEFGVLQVKERGVFNKLEINYFNQIKDEIVDGFEHVYAYDEQNVFIGTEKGFLHFNPSSIQTFEFPFNLNIRKVSLIHEGDSAVYYGGIDDSNSNYSGDFSYKENDLRFTFAASYYEKEKHTTYRFFLEGFDKEWSTWTSRTEKEYTNLSSGKYTFKVQARNSYGEISKEVIYKFRVRPAWYASTYARICYFILIVIILLVLIQFISRREEKKTLLFKEEQEKKLEKKEAEFKKEVEKTESEIVKLSNDKLQADINHKNSQLASATMHLVQKSEILMKIKGDLGSLNKAAPNDLKKQIDSISRTIDYDILQDNSWEQFEMSFDQVHENFFKRLRQKYPDLTPKDQKLCAYLRMNLSTKEIAPLLNISVRGVEISRYRLRKKLDIDSNTNLIAFIMEV